MNAAVAHVRQSQPQQRAPSRAPADLGGIVEYFSHQGVWSPGVKLFRTLQFRTKALLVSVAFLVPLFALMY